MKTIKESGANGKGDAVSSAIYRMQVKAINFVFFFVLYSENDYEMGRFQVPDERNGTSVQGQNSRFGRGEFCTRPAKDIHNHPEGERERGGGKRGARRREERVEQLVARVVNDLVLLVGLSQH